MNKKAFYTDVQKILDDLDRIPVRDYRIYVEQYEESQWQLDEGFFNESHYQWRYASSLYEIGEHEAFLKESDKALIYLVNQTNWEGRMRQKYLDLLFQKAISHTRLKEYKKADKSCKELKALGFDKRKIKFLKRHIFKSEAKSLILLLDNERFYLFLLAALSSSLAYLVFTKLL